jgi:cell wall-associated NlpC family hydrolase
MAEEYIGQDEPEGLSEKAAKYGITGSRFDNMRFPIKGGAMISGQDDESVPAHLADVQAELRAIRASMPPMGAALSQAQTAREVQQAQESIARQVRDSIDRLGQIRLAHFGEVNTSRLEANLSELNKRAFGMQATLGGYGSTQYSAIGPTLQPLREMTDQMRQGQRFTEYQQRQAIEQASRDRARVALDPNLSDSVKRYYTSQIATEQRRLQDIGRFSVLETPRGMPDEGLRGRFPGLQDRFQEMQNIRGRIEAGRDTSGRLTDERQRQLRAEIDLEQRKLRIMEQQIRASGEMTKETQHQFNIQNSELNRTRRDMERGPAAIMTPTGVTRMVGAQGGRAVLGQALQQFAYNRGDIQGTGTLATLGGVFAAQGIGGTIVRGAEMVGSKAALGAAELGAKGIGVIGSLAGAGTVSEVAPAIAGPAAGVIGGLGAMAAIPALGAVAAGLAGVLSQVQPAAQHGMEVERLYRAGGAGGGLGGVGQVGPGESFLGQGYYREILNAGQAQEGRPGRDLGFSRDDVLQVAGTLARVGGTEGPGGLGRDRIRPVLEFARYMGTGAQETAQQFGLMERNDLLRNPGAPGARPEQDQKRFADLIAQSIAQSGMRGREQEVLGAVAGLTSSIAQRGLDVNVDRIMSLVTTLNKEGGPGLRGQAGQEALSTINEGIIGARGPQQAMLYNIYRQAAAKQGRQLGPMDFLGEQAAGLGSDFAMEGVQNITDLAHGNMNLAAGFLTAQYAGGDLHQFGRMRRLAELARDKRLTPEELTRTQQELERGGPGGTGVLGAGIPVGVNPETGEPDVTRLGNAENLNASMVKLTNNFEDAASKLQPLIAGLADVASNMMGIANSVIQMFAGGGTADIGGILGQLPSGLRGMLDTALGAFRGPTPQGNPNVRTPGQTMYGPSTGRATLTALPYVGATGVAKRIGDATGGGVFTPENIATLRSNREGLVPQGGTGPNADSEELVTAFNASFPNAANEVPPYEEMVAFYNRWVEQHRQNIPEAKGIAQEHLQGLAQRWGNLRYSQAGHGNLTLEAAAAGLGTDCSGFVSAILRAEGVEDIPQNSNLNTGNFLDPKYTTQVSQENAIPGDVVVNAEHMGIYTGSSIVAMQNERLGVQELPVSQFLGPSGGGYQFRRMNSVMGREAGVNVPNALAGLSLLSPQGIARSGLPNVSGQAQTLGGDVGANRNAVIRESLRLGFSPLTALAAIGPEGGFGDPMQQEHRPFGNPRQVEPGMGMFQFTNVPPDARGQGGSDTLTRYRNWVRNERGLDPASREAWTPELQTEWWFTQYAANRGVTVPGANATPEQIGPALQRIQGPAGNQSARYTAAAREQQQFVQQYLNATQTQQGLPAVDTGGIAPGGGRVNEETTSPAFTPGVTDPDNIFNSVPLGAEGMLAQQQMINISFGLATVRIEDMAGNLVGQGELRPQVMGDAVAGVNREPTIGTMGYVG